VGLYSGGLIVGGLRYIFHTVSLNFQRIVPVSYGKYAVSHSGFFCVLN
jgi:hypothetical protein